MKIAPYGTFLEPNLVLKHNDAKLSLAFSFKLLNHHVVTELMMIDVLMNNMMERISDPCCTVRMLAIRGLGNIATGSPEKVQRSDLQCRLKKPANIHHVEIADCIIGNS